MKVSLDGCQGKILLRKYDCSARVWVFKLSVGGQVADIRNTKRKYKHKPLLNFIQSDSPPLCSVAKLKDAMEPTVAAFP